MQQSNSIRLRYMSRSNERVAEAMLMMGTVSHGDGH